MIGALKYRKTYFQLISLLSLKDRNFIGVLEIALKYSRLNLYCNYVLDSISMNINNNKNCFKTVWEQYMEFKKILFAAWKIILIKILSLWKEIFFPSSLTFVYLCSGILKLYEPSIYNILSKWIFKVILVVVQALSEFVFQPIIPESTAEMPLF